VWWGAFVVRRPDGFVAFPARCAHRVAYPCVLAWRPDRTAQGFACFCPGGGWDPATGDPIAAPPPDGDGFVPHGAPAWPLPSLPVGVTAGRVRVGLAGAKERIPGQPPLVALAR
jgi:nitrite reductase/ring-hydroxylating ferredoxin subunit